MGRSKAPNIVFCPVKDSQAVIGGPAVRCLQCASDSEYSQICPNCKVARHVGCFQNGRQRCAVCLAYNRGNYLKHRDQRNRADVARLYRMPLADYHAVLERYDNRCAICGGHSRQQSKRDGRQYALHVDHDHITGQFRGLLCYRCNQILGWIEQTDWAIVERAREYIAGRVGPIFEEVPMNESAEAVAS